MEVHSTYKYARISARKVRDVTRAIQGLPVSQALDVLTFTPRKAAQLVGKTVRSAMANAENNFELALESLVIKEATVGEGPTFRRFRPRARGSAAPIRKRTSHIRIVLTDEIELPEPRQRGDKKKAQKPAKAASQPKEEAPQKAKEPKAAEAAAPGEATVDEKLGTIYASAPAEVDDLKLINGVGKVLEEKLNEHGVYRFEQIANWTEENIAAFDELLAFKGRVERDEWVAKASELHEEKYGK